MSELLKRAGWNLLEFLRRAVTPFVLCLLFGMTMFAVSGIETPELKYLLMAALFVLTFVTVFLLMRSMGEFAYKIKVTSEKRSQGLPGGLDLEKEKIKYHPGKEYRHYKGFAIGLFVCLIPIIFTIIDVTLHSSGARLAYAMTAGWAIMPVLVINKNASLLFCFIPCAIQIIVCGVGFILGGKKEEARQRELDERAETVSRVKGEKKH